MDINGPAASKDQNQKSPFISGPWIVFDGVEDNTIRPSRRTEWLRNGQPPPSEETLGGPDLIDWLNRTFD
jgi:hypothetical protein